MVALKNCIPPLSYTLKMDAKILKLFCWPAFFTCIPRPHPHLSCVFGDIHNDIVPCAKHGVTHHYQIYKNIVDKKKRENDSRGVCILCVSTNKGAQQTFHGFVFPMQQYLYNALATTP